MGLGPDLAVVVIPVVVLPDPEVFPLSLADLSPASVVGLAKTLSLLHDALL